MKLPASAIIVVCLLSFPLSCEGAESGKIAVSFKAGISREEAVSFIKGINLEIISAHNFNILGLHFVVGENLYPFINAIDGETVVRSATEGGKFKIGEREGTVVKVTFNEGTNAREIDRIRDKYNKEKGVIAWRYLKKEPSYLLVRVPEGQEEAWINTLNKPQNQYIISHADRVSYHLR